MSNTIYGRVELVQKTAADLVLTSLSPETKFNVTAVSAGYIRELFRGSRATCGLGLQGTLNHVPNDLEPFYGSPTPVGAMVFLRVRPVHTPHHMSQNPMDMGGAETILYRGII
jgi:hypothetical protein